MGSTFNLRTICVLFLLSWVAEARSTASVFNVKKYGAMAGGKKDISQALTSAWKDACASEGVSTVLIPRRSYLLRPVVLAGPCKGTAIRFLIKGIVKAPADPAAFKTDGWVVFRYINGLTISGGGTFDGQGQKAWAINNCAQNPHCNQLPTNIRFDFLNNTVVRDITSLNSKNFHMNLLACNDMTIQRVNITAPENSINTDGIHIGRSARVNITDSVIGTGDDCVSIGPGSRNLTITKVACGPGHGISVGSLGKYKDEEDVFGITVRNCTFTGTANGVRVKTWPSSPAGLASDLIFEDIIVNNVFNPIIVDQEYCPHLKCDRQAPSRVKLNNVRFNNIRGTSSSQLAVIIACSRGVPCENVEVGDINLKYHGVEGPATSTCSNVKAILSGEQIPPTCA